MTTLLINYLNKINLFNIYLFTRRKKENNEYSINNVIKRVVIRKNLIKAIKKNKIDILIYMLSFFEEINLLNKHKDIKTIFFIHNSITYYIYSNYTGFKFLYSEYTKSKYIVSIIPFENNYLFKKWSINSILMNNFMTYQFNSIIPSDLSEKKILLIGRGNDKKKRFEIGIQAMEYIIKEIPECLLKIISNLKGINNLQNLVNNLILDKNIKFLGYSLIPEIFYKKVSLHFFPTISESFGLVLSETKLYGIPSILLGLDYVSISKGGTSIIYDDKPETLAKETIKILKNEKYIKKMGKEARKAMKKFNNEILFKRWIKLILSVYNGGNYYSEIINNEINYKTNFLKILNNQVKLLQMRNKEFKNFSKENFLNFSIMKNLF